MSIAHAAPRVVNLAKETSPDGLSDPALAVLDLWPVDTNAQVVASAYAGDLTCVYHPITGVVLGLDLGGRTACTVDGARVTIPLSSGYVSGLALAPGGTAPQVGSSDDWLGDVLFSR